MFVDNYRLAVWRHRRSCRLPCTRCAQPRYHRRTQLEAGAGVRALGRSDRVTVLGAVQLWAIAAESVNTRSNLSLDRTATSRLRLLASAAHLER
jgi:hypothetical protein